MLPLSAAYGVRTALIVSGLAGLAAAAVLVLYAKTLKHEPKPATLRKMLEMNAPAAASRPAP